MQGTIAEIRGFGGNFAPRSWAYCAGQLLAISQNSALFSIIGTIYGGDGRTTFALPDLRGRVPIHVGGTSGTGPGLSTIRLGQRGGTTQTYITQSQMPSHTHQAVLNARKEAGDSFNPTGKVLAADPGTPIYNASTPDVNMGTGALTVSPTGGSQSFDLTNPYLGINMIICMYGIYPSRN